VCPAPHADALLEASVFSNGTRRHILRHLKGSVKVPHTSLVDGEHGKVLLFYVRDNIFVRHSYRAAVDIRYIVGMPLCAVRIWTHRITTARNLPVRVIPPPLRRALVASDLYHITSSCMKYEGIGWPGFVKQMTVKPPIKFGTVHHRVLWTTRDCGIILMKAPHGRVPDG
jgi:hypothetical protein